MKASLQYLLSYYYQLDLHCKDYVCEAILREKGPVYFTINKYNCQGWATDIPKALKAVWKKRSSTSSSITST